MSRFRRLSEPASRNTLSLKGNNRLWFSTFGDTALIRYDSSTGEAVRFSSEDGLPSNRVRTVYERTDGTIMVACTGGLALISDDTVTDDLGSSSSTFLNSLSWK